ncbi:MAG: DegT/DnrJ/EryC1/StrS family aminotransferase [bacterium]|nr:DegT/DnrJ/EryC1/StrS family aminotransferase [bacterium]
MSSERERIPLSAPDLTQSEIDAVVEVLRSPSLSLGPKLGEFERALAAVAGTRHAVALSSGTAGLHVCLRAFGVGAGDEVITTPFSFIASANVALYEGARPVFVDVDADTLNLDASRVESSITARTRAILAVHAFGVPADMQPLRALASRHGLHLIEDACEALGGEVEGRRLGSLGDAGVFAFYPNKQITTGEGGALVTDDESLARRVAGLRNHGRDPSDPSRHAYLGFNYRLSDIQCALGLAQLQRLPEILERRREVARAYETRLRGVPGLVLPVDLGSSGSWFVYVVRLSEELDAADRDAIHDDLRERGIGCGRYFAPIHLHEFYRDAFGHRPGDFPVAEAAAERTLALPFFNRLQPAQIDEVCEFLAERIAARRGSR